VNDEQYAAWAAGQAEPAGAYDRIQISHVLCTPDGRGQRSQLFDVRVNRPGDTAHAATVQHLDKLTRAEMTALFDRIWEALQQT